MRELMENDCIEILRLTVTSIWYREKTMRPVFKNKTRCHFKMIAPFTLNGAE